MFVSLLNLKPILYLVYFFKDINWLKQGQKHWLVLYYSDTNNKGSKCLMVMLAPVNNLRSYLFCNINSLFWE